MGRDTSDRDENEKTMIATAAPRGTTARNRGVVTLLSGNEVGRVLSIRAGHPIKMGRVEECTLRFDDPSLSRVHATIQCILSEFIIRDEGSTNGTYVNDVRLDAAVPLRDGDRIQLGTNTMLRFSLVNDEEEAALKRVWEAGRRDGLTGISNRKAFEERLDSEFAYAVRHKSSLCLTMMDVDFFKKINDGYGHPAGDAVLKNVAALLTKGLRSEDMVARYGGEEFAIITRGIEAFGASLMADRLRMMVQSTPITFEGREIRVTMSGGVASVDCLGNKVDKAGLVSLADARLYKAKQSGRNRIIGPDY